AKRKGSEFQARIACGIRFRRTWRPESEWLGIEFGMAHQPAHLNAGIEGPTDTVLERCFIELCWVDFCWDRYAGFIARPIGLEVACSPLLEEGVLNRCQ